MCGICGQLCPDRAQLVEREFLRAMNHTLRHRGPDNEGYEVRAGVGLAISRLAIIDVAGGQQPISNEDGSVVVVFNGEIYNFQELRCELEGVGHRFATRSDTEVIVHAYEQWGDEALHRFNGMFAIALWDARLNGCSWPATAWVRSPSIGIIPLKVCCGAQAKALLVAPWIERRVKPLSLHHYLTLQYVPDPLTIFEGIHRLPAAHKLVIERDGSPIVSRWWQLEFEPKLKIEDAEAIEHSRKLLSAAVKRRLISGCHWARY